MPEQPAWNPHASIAWKVDWHRARLWLIYGDAERYPYYMRKRAALFLRASEREQRLILWPHGEPA